MMRRRAQFVAMPGPWLERLLDLMGTAVRYLIYNSKTGRGFLEMHYPFRLGYLKLPETSQAWFLVDRPRDYAVHWVGVDDPATRAWGVWHERGQGCRNDLVHANNRIKGPPSRN